MPLHLIAIIFISILLLLIAAPFAIQIGSLVALITFFFGFGILSIFRKMQLGGSVKQESFSTSPDPQLFGPKAASRNRKIWQMIPVNRGRLLDPNSEWVEWKPSRE
jgi:hypothetical protein